MKFYTLDVQPEPIFPQLDCLTQEHTPSLKSNKIPKFVPELIFRLVKEAKPTDALSQASISACGLLVSERFKNLLMNYKLIDYKFFEAKIIDIATPYHWMHLISDLTNINWLDYKNSTFSVYEFGFKEGHISLTSYEDYCKKIKEISDMSTIEIENIKLNSNFDDNIDLFIIPLLTRELFISERLKNAIQAENLTGIIIKEALIS